MPTSRSLPSPDAPSDGRSDPDSSTPGSSATPSAQHQAADLQGATIASRLNWLRAGVLGANDGIVSVAGLVVGVAGATADRTAILTAGVAGVIAGALSMAGGEYVSVSSQRDTEQALLAKEKWELQHLPEQELAELSEIYRGKGLNPQLAHQVAIELTQHNALAAHADAELGIDPDDLTNPLHAALASFAAFFVGAVLPVIAILLPAPTWRVPVCFGSILLALALTGWLSAWAGGSTPGRPIWRNMLVGAASMGITYGVGSVVGAAV